jgi:hypothetical protein
MARLCPYFETVPLALSTALSVGFVAGDPSGSASGTTDANDLPRTYFHAERALACNRLSTCRSCSGHASNSPLVSQPRPPHNLQAG